ncbi:formyltransferase family protein [Falsiroseomonas ponticola]|uniref:formyltransferase family protein n=1 Tax=Falsiroseomonas ponticola TaxID=2786951 RepID=UPI0019337B31|nr:formyltransferase family protein [Roseomonas ponticola]
MGIVFFASGGPGNFAAALAFCDSSPLLAALHLLVADRVETPAAQLARQRGISVIEHDFEAICGSWHNAKGNPLAQAAYRRRARDFHDAIEVEIAAFSRESGRPLDLAVLAYRRIIEGTLLERFHHRMINQHPADLAVCRNGQRAYVGIGGLRRSIEQNEPFTRTSTILVTAGVDAGPILCRGPSVRVRRGEDGCAVDIKAHELIQKEVSDWPSLTFALKGIAEGRFSLSDTEHNSSGNPQLNYDGVPLGPGGVDLDLLVH